MDSSDQQNERKDRRRLYWRREWRGFVRRQCRYKINRKFLHKWWGKANNTQIKEGLGRSSQPVEEWAQEQKEDGPQNRREFRISPARAIYPVLAQLWQKHIRSHSAWDGRLTSRFRPCQFKQAPCQVPGHLKWAKLKRTRTAAGPRAPELESKLSPTEV